MTFTNFFITPSSIPHTGIFDLHYSFISPVEYTTYLYIRSSLFFFITPVEYTTYLYIRSSLFFYFPGRVYHIPIYSTFTNFFIFPIKYTIYRYIQPSLIFLSPSSDTPFAGITDLIITLLYHAFKEPIQCNNLHVHAIRQNKRIMPQISESSFECELTFIHKQILIRYVPRIVITKTSRLAVIKVYGEFPVVGCLGSAFHKRAHMAQSFKMTTDLFYCFSLFLIAKSHKLKTKQ